MKTITVSALEYEALLNVEKMMRLAMEKPDCGEFLVSALMALDAVRKAETPALMKPKNEVSALASALINRAMEK